MMGFLRIEWMIMYIEVTETVSFEFYFYEQTNCFIGECSKETTFEILDHFYENGGNFIDTANNYQKEESERREVDWRVNGEQRRAGPDGRCYKGTSAKDCVQILTTEALAQM
jgi:hypothetical protein